jgi:hypothetical protein
MKNGYALPSRSGLVEIAKQLRALNESEIDRLRQKLRIGIQWNTQVTLNNCKHLVSQAYCAALPVAYTDHSPELWAEFAQLVLEGAYEATICAAVLNSVRNGNNRAPSDTARWRGIWQSNRLDYWSNPACPEPL